MYSTRETPLPSFSEIARDFPAPLFILDGSGHPHHVNTAGERILSAWGEGAFCDSLLEALRHGVGEEQWSRWRHHRGGFTAREAVLKPPVGASLGHRFTCTGHWFDPAHVSPDSPPWMFLAAWEITPFQRCDDRTAMADLHADMLRLEMVRKIREALLGAQFHFEAINSILASALALQEKDVMASPSAEVLTMALEAGRKAAGVLGRALPAVEPEVFKPVHLNHILRDVLTLFTQRMLAQGVEVIWRPSGDLPLLYLQENALRVACKELIENALDAMAPPWKGARELTLATTALEEGVRITVADTGPGISPEDRRRIFHPFFSRKPGGCGAGMGLPLVQEVVNRHGGAVDVEVGDPAGCLFHIVIPMGER